METKQAKVREVALAALIAVCGAAKLDRTYLPPSSAATAGGNADSLQAPLTKTSEQAEPSESLPTGSYNNNFQGVVVDAASGPDTRASPDGTQSGLGGPRDTYGSENSKVGDAAFRGSLAGFRTSPYGNTGFNGQVNPGQSQNGQISGINQGPVSDNSPVSGIATGQEFGSFESKSERPQAFSDRNSNIITYSNDVSVDNYSYGFETDNGIAVGENGVANNGIQAQGGYSYKGDDGQVYKVTYVADEGGYRPQGAHLPTPPPIPKEILESLEKNAKDEAAGLIDDGSYDAQKYNAEGDYTHHDGGNIQYNGAQSSQFAKRPESDATASNTFINENSQAFGKPAQFGNTAQNAQPNLDGAFNFNGQSNQFGANFGNKPNNFVATTQKESFQDYPGQQASTSNYQSFGQYSGSQVGRPQGGFGSQNSQISKEQGQQAQIPQSPQFSSQSAQGSKPQVDGQTSPFGSHSSQQSESGQFGSFVNQGQPLSGSALQSGRPSSSSSFGYNSQLNQNGNQAFKPQSSFGGEYLPPFNSNDRPINNNPQTNEILNSQDSNKDNKPIDFVPLKSQNQGLAQGSSVTSFASSGPTSSPVFNGFQKQPNRPNRFNLNSQSESNTLSTSSQPIGSLISGLATEAKPTSIPDTELTTPLEPNEKPAFSQNSQFNSQSTPSFGNFGSQTLNSQTQSLVGFQNNVVNSLPQVTSQYDSSSPTPTVFPTIQQPANKESQTFVNQNQQYNGYYSTQKPSFSQGPDDSYYYNQPSKPFGTSIHPQGSRFPNSPSYKPNGFGSQNNQNFNQQGSLTQVVPTPSSQFSQSQGSYSNNYNGITQASISPFPPVSPTTSTRNDTTLSDGFGSKPSSQFKPVTTFGQKPSLSFNQNQFSQISSNSNSPSGGQSLSAPVRPNTASGQIGSTSFNQNQPIQSSNNEDQPKQPDTSKEQETSIQTQQYDGELYEYNKPPEVLPAPEQTDSSSSPTTQTDTSSTPEGSQEPNQDSKPQLGSQQLQFRQNTLFSQSQQSNLNQGSKPFIGSQTYKPFGNTPSGNSQYGLNIQSALTQQYGQGTQTNGQVAKPIESVFSTSTQLGQGSQTVSGSKPQLTSQPAKPFGTASNFPQFGQNNQQQIQGTQYGVQPFKPFTGAQASPSQFGQITQSSFGSAIQQSAVPQFSSQQNKPFGSASSPSQKTQNQASFTGSFTQQQISQNGVQPAKPFGAVGYPQNSQPIIPFGSTGTQSFQGYPSTRPQLGTELIENPIQNSHTENPIQTTFGSSQYNSQPANEGQANPGLAQPTSSFNQQTFQNSQYGSSRPQFGPQFNQNQNTPIKPFNTATSGAQFGQNTAQASSSAISQPSAIQAYKPFGSASSSTNFQSQGKPQNDQASQSSLGFSTTSSPPQFDSQSFNNAGNQVSSQPQASEEKSPCCKSTTGSAIAPLNVGKPSQAFAQTQSQFAGFQGPVGLNTQSLQGKGEDFSGPRQPPSFDAQTGYHYK